MYWQKSQVEAAAVDVLAQLRVYGNVNQKVQSATNPRVEKDVVVTNPKGLGAVY